MEIFMLNKKLFLAVACLAIAHTAFPAAESAQQRLQREQRELNQAMAASAAQYKQEQELNAARQEAAAMARPAAQPSRYEQELKAARQELAARPAIIKETAAQREQRHMNAAIRATEVGNQPVVHRGHRAPQPPLTEEKYNNFSKPAFKREFNHDTSLLNDRLGEPKFADFYRDRMRKWDDIAKKNAPQYPGLYIDIEQWKDAWYNKFGVPR
jgi:hypothetical protein